MNLIGHILNNRYRIVQKVGEDFLFNIYKSADIITANIIQINIFKQSNDALRADNLTGFIKETTKITTLENPVLYKILDIGEHEKYTYIVTEFFNGTRLSDLLSYDNLQICDIRVGTENTLRIMLRLAEVIDYIHQHDIYHGDINPENVFIDLENNLVSHIKITGFGLSKIKDNIQLNNLNDIRNKFGYTHPNVNDQINKKTAGQNDLYSLGILFYHLITGILPFNGDNIETIINKHLSANFALPSEINKNILKDIDHIILKLMNKNKIDLYHSAYDFLSELKKFVEAKDCPG